MLPFHAAADACPSRTRGHKDFCADGEPVALYLRRLFLPIGQAGEATIIALADDSPENVSWIRAAYGECQLVYASRPNLLTEIGRRYHARLTDDSIFALSREKPALSAHRVVTPGQGAALALFSAVIALAAWRTPIAMCTAFVMAMSLVFNAGTLFRVVLSWLGGLPRAEAVALPSHDDPNLPVYSILIPLFREAKIVPDLRRALLSLDYPSDRLDIKLIVEADDEETAKACDELGELRGFEVVRVPPSLPRTKPKAVNFALRHARGDLLVIYDAEDRPEPDQLLKAVAAFRSLPRAVACLQARLTFYNQDGWLPKLFALDYFLWFNSMLPGLERLGVPMPLGGTSNHFRTAVLREIGAWDPFNVTEDADIGIRLAQLGYRTAMLDSTTFEEAPTQVGVWIKQRSRWLKGYMQTWLVHGRNAGTLIRQVGIGGFLAFQLFVGGAVLSALINPILWAIFALSYAVPFPIFGNFPGDALGYTSAVGAIGSNGLLTYLAVAGPARRGDPKLAPYGLTVAIYWMLISIAGYRGLWHLVTKPFHWEKTTHGLSDEGSNHA